MLKKTLLILLALLFVASFWWAHGDGGPTGNLLVATHRQTTEANVSLWDRCYRMIALKSAVQRQVPTTYYIPLNRIPADARHAIIAVEDKRFYTHMGFDMEGILRATLVNIQTGRITEGGSTITQQLVKNLFLHSERSFSRKIEEFLLAINMELRYSKDEILELYFNSIYFGSGMYGIGEASSGYFNKPSWQLTLSECAMLSGLPNAPSLMSPYVDVTAAKERQAIVLNAMVRQGYISQAQAQEALEVQLKFAR